MKEEARFQVRGTAVELLDETYGESEKLSMILRVQLGADKHMKLKVGVLGDTLIAVARASKGRQVLVLGRVNGVISKAGFYNTYLNAEAILVEPKSERAYGAADPTAARDASYGVASPMPSAHERAKANGYAPEPVPLEEADDISF